MTAHKKRMLTTLVAGMLLVVTLTSNIVLFILVFRDVNARVRRDIGLRTRYALEAILPTLDVEGFSRLVREKNPQDPYYRQLQAYLSIVRERLGFKYLYTTARDASGKIIYVVDGLPPDADGFSPLGSFGDETEEEGWNLVMATNGPATQESSSPRWGELMSVYVPIRDSSGAIVGLLGADHEMSTVLAAVATRARFFAGMILLITLAGIGAGVLAIFLVGRAEARRLKAHDQLERAYEELERQKRELAASEETLRVIIDAPTESILLMEADGRIRGVNKALCEQVGELPVDLINKHVDDFRGDEFAVFQKLRQTVEASRKVEHLERESGDKLLSYTAYPVLDENGKLAKIAVHAQDIAWRRQMERALRESEERFRCAFESAAAGIALSDLDGKLVKVNRSFCEMLGVTEKEIVGTELRDITHPEDVDNDVLPKAKLLAGELSEYHVEKRFRSQRGNMVYGILSASMVKDDQGKPMYAIGMIQDITDRKLMEEMLARAKLEAEQARAQAEYMARTDFLTGLKNRRAFIEKLEEEMARTLRDKEKKTIGLILTDIDHFKKVNDTYGHDVGDEVLKVFAQCLEKNCRKYDFVGRHGGEEFIIALPETDLEAALSVAERARKTVEGTEIPAGEGKNLRITASFGVALFSPRDGDTIDSAIIRADHALYRAKTGGRNRVESIQ